MRKPVNFCLNANTENSLLLSRPEIVAKQSKEILTQSRQDAESLSLCVIAASR